VCVPSAARAPAPLTRVYVCLRVRACAPDPLFLFARKVRGQVRGPPGHKRGMVQQAPREENRADQGAPLEDALGQAGHLRPAHAQYPP
jgi:hypothetical protein